MKTKNCPYCKAKPKFHRYEGELPYQFECMYCRLAAPRKKFKAQSGDAWNDLVGAVEMLENLATIRLRMADESLALGAFVKDDGSINVSLLARNEPRDRLTGAEFDVEHWQNGIELLSKAAIVKL